MSTKKYAHNEEVQEVVLDALHFVNSLSSFIVIFLNEDDDNIAINTISQRMRGKLSKPVIFSALQMIMRLSEFAEESKNAFEQDRNPGLPIVKSHVDYTMRVIWIKWVEQMTKYNDSQWSSVTNNPYENIWNGLEKLSTRIWRKHFNVKI